MMMKSSITELFNCWMGLGVLLVLAYFAKRRHSSAQACCLSQINASKGGGPSFAKIAQYGGSTYLRTW
jgi:hypothetical protein